MGNVETALGRARAAGRPILVGYVTGGIRDDWTGLLARTEGILPALESAHALAWVHRAARSGDLTAGASVLVTLSGRGDKDAAQLKELTRGRR